MNFNDCGILFISIVDENLSYGHCTGDIKKSIDFLKSNMGDIDITVITNTPDEFKNVNTIYFKINKFDWGVKIKCLSMSPYNKTLYLDGDTTIVEPIYEIFEILNKFDLTLCHAPHRKIYEFDDVPDAFCEFNTGLIGYNINNLDNFFDNWLEVYYDLKNNINKDKIISYSGKINDQPSMRKSLYTSDINFYVLPSEYNLRTIFPFMKGGNSSVKVLHGSCLININEINKEYDKIIVGYVNDSYNIKEFIIEKRPLLKNEI